MRWWDFVPKCQFEKTPPLIWGWGELLSKPQIQEKPWECPFWGRPTAQISAGVPVEAQVTRKYYRDTVNLLCPSFREPGCGQGRGAGGRGWPPAPSAPGSGVRTGTPGSQHQLKAVKVNEGRRGVWHRSTQAHKGGFSKSRESSNRRTPGGRLSRRGSYLGSALGAAAFPGGDKARGGQGKASDPDGALPILREPPSSRPRPDAEERSSEPAQRGPRARRHRLARRCLWSVDLPARTPARGRSGPRAAHAQYPCGARASVHSRAARPPANSALRVLPAAEWRSMWSTPALEENRRVGPSGRERGGRKGGEARCPVIKAVIKAGPQSPAADGFPEVP